MRGHVVKWISERGFGFVKPDHVSSKDIYFHATAIEGGEDTIFFGAPVEYDLDDSGGSRPSAMSVKVCCNDEAR
jgi:cold shock CspA family protein